MKHYHVQNIGPYKGMQVNYQEHDYEFSGSSWFDMESKGIPPLVVVARLNGLARQQLLG